ncbi:DnaA ATPase domain-containing protein [uncultured Veillonella sp.]|uniref:DnaA ATPase domain-containing protein n=1 Tax=uncultured Veillonella sp. TaxID=159268 RepID=UPI0025DEE03D|nr:DnaA/Hda family protein [uncultured Veillonella sp.]
MSTNKDDMLVSKVSLEDNVKDAVMDVSGRLRDIEYNPMILHGKAAHTAQFLKELATYEADFTANWNIMEITGEQLAKDYTDSVTYGHVADFMERFVKLDRIIVTNFDFVLESADELEQRAIVRIIQGLKGQMRQVVLTIEAEVLAYEANIIPEMVTLLANASEVGIK